MAKQTPENEELIVDVQEVYSKTETFIDDNKSIITSVVGGLIILIAGYFAYNSFYLAPLEDEAKDEMFMAEKYFRLDSFNLAIDGRADFAGFIEIADNYSSTKAGDLANYYLGISFLNVGQFENAIDALNNFNGDDAMLATLAIGAKGDALLELENTKKAIDQYTKAANRNENEFTTPLFLMKAARAMEMVGDYEGAAENYNRIKIEYRTSPEGSDIEKFIARAEAKL